MPVPSTIVDLNVTAVSNSPAGTDSVTTASGPDEYFRAINAIVRREQAQFTAVASAATVDLGAIATGNYGHITGTTTITSFGTVAAGISRVVVFDAALTLTHNATSLILPGGVNIVTAAGDMAEFVSEGAGNWRCKEYQRIAVPPSVPLDASVVTAKIADLAVTTAKIADLGVTTAKLADLGVTTAKLADLNVTTAKIADLGVTTGKVADDAVTYAKIQNVSATDRLLGRSTAGAGDVEEITCTAFARTVLDDADAAIARTTLGAVYLDVGYGAVGCIAMVGDSNNYGSIITSGQAITASGNLKCASMQNGALVYGANLTGTWRNLGPDIANVVNWYTTMQRIS